MSSRKIHAHKQKPSARRARPRRPSSPDSTGTALVRPPHSGHSARAERRRERDVRETRAHNASSVVNVVKLNWLSRFGNKRSISNKRSFDTDRTRSRSRSRSGDWASRSDLPRAVRASFQVSDNPSILCYRVARAPSPHTHHLLLLVHLLTQRDISHHTKQQSHNNNISHARGREDKTTHTSCPSVPSRGSKSCAGGAASADATSTPQSSRPRLRRPVVVSAIPSPRKGRLCCVHSVLGAPPVVAKRHACLVSTLPPPRCRRRRAAALLRHCATAPLRATISSPPSGTRVRLSYSTPPTDPRPLRAGGAYPSRLLRKPFLTSSGLAPEMQRAQPARSSS